MFNWWQIHQGQHLGWLFRKLREPLEAELEQLRGIWVALYEDYVKRYGFSEGFLDQLRSEIYIARLIARKATGDRGADTLIKVEEVRLEEVKKKSIGMTDYYLLKASMESALGFTINPRECTVAEFQSYLTTIKQRKHG